MVGYAVTDGHVLGAGIIGVLDEGLDASVDGSIPEKSVAVGSLYVLDETEAVGSGVDEVGGTAHDGVDGQQDHVEEGLVPEEEL